MVKFSFVCVNIWVHQYEHEIERNVLGELYRYLAIETRDRLELSQEEMAELLYMSTSSYSDIETGATNCVGTLTATRLLSLQEDPSVFLRKTEEAISKYIAKELQPV